jgi:hypothetical protein
MAWITKTITYKVPNQRHSMDDSEGKTSTDVYHGPSKLILWLCKTDKTEGEDYGKNDIMHVWDADDMTERPMPLDCYQVELDATESDEMALRAGMLAPKGGHEDHEAQRHGDVCDGLCFKKPKLYEIECGPADQDNKIIADPSHIMEVYAKQDIANDAYDPATGKWKALKYRTGITEDRTDDSVREIRNGHLSGSDNMFNEDMPAAMKQEWLDWRQKLRDLPADWKDVPNEFIVFPREPGTVEHRYSEDSDKDDVVWIKDRSEADADALKQIENISNVG